jgi:hypothetical protein
MDTQIERRRGSGATGPPRGSRREDGLLYYARHVGVVVYLLALIVLLLFLAAGTLAGYEFQERIERTQVQENGSVISVLIDASEAEATLYELRIAQADLRQLNDRLAGIPAADRVGTLTDSVNARYWSTLDPLLAGLDGYTDVPLASVRTPAQYRRYVAALPPDALPAERIEQVGSLVDAFEQDLTAARSAPSAGAGDPGEGATSTGDATVLQKQRELLEARIQELGEQVAAYGALVPIGRELQHLRQICLPFSAASGSFCLGVFAEQTRSVLVLLLTIAMGALGSTIFITEQYLSGQARDRSMQWFAIRPLLGVVTAIAIFVLAKAGQLAFSEPNAAEGGLNPWTISFPAIVSGLLSESAIQRLSEAGRSVFSTGQLPERERWVITEMLDGRDAAPARLGEQLALPEDQVEAWLEGREAVPERGQELLAAWLRVPRRRLFSDLPP